MVCVLVAALLSCAPLPVDSTAQPATAAVDPWIGEDKVRHFSMSYAMVGFGDAAARSLGAADDAALRAAVLVAAVAGVLKEVHDRARGDIFSYRDLAWNVAGIAAGILVVRAAR